MSPAASLVAGHPLCGTRYPPLAALTAASYFQAVLAPGRPWAEEPCCSRPSSGSKGLANSGRPLLIWQRGSPLFIGR